jgi:DNA-binding NarL/FixJ family response regulator
VTTPEPCKLLVVDDDAMVRQWVKFALEGSEFVVAAEATSGDEVEDVIMRRGPAALLVDYRLGASTGTELIRRLRLGGIELPALLMTANEERGLNEAAREAAAQGTVLKTGSGDELLMALRRILAGGTSFDSRHPARERGVAALSPREREVLKLVAAGATNAQVAEQLGIGRESVKTLVSRAFAKLGATKRAEAVSEAHRRGLL